MIASSDTKNIKLKNYTKFISTIKNNQKEDTQTKIKASAYYIEHIKVHDKKAYKNYLSYSTYLNLDGHI